MGTNTIKNWDGTQHWQPEAIIKPVDEAEISASIQRAIEEGKRIKPIGSALSWSDIIDIPAIAFQFGNMAKVLEVDHEAKRIRMQAGTKLVQVNDVLADHSLALDNFGSIIKQTAAGYIATASHGTGARTQILSAYVDGICLVDGLGKVHYLDPNHEADLFSAARVHLGCLGVVTEITFRCVDAFDLEERLELVEFDTALADLDSIIKDNDYCKLWWLPYTDKLQFYLFNKTAKPRGGAGFSGFMDQTGISGVSFTVLIALGRFIPNAIPFIHSSVQKFFFHPHRRVDRSDKVIKVGSSIPVHQEVEYAIPIGEAAAAIDETRKLILKGNYRVNFPLEVRFVAADDIPMSPTYGRDSCYIGPYVSSLKWAPPLFAEFEELMRDYGGRPHWGKSFSLTGDELRELYPAYDSFNQLRQRCDPHGLFRNSFVDRVFPE